MSTPAWILAGALLAAMGVVLVRGLATEARFWALALVAVALVYPAVATAADVPGVATREFVGALPWIGVALAWRRFGLVLLATAWVLHGVWDLMPVVRPWMPDFYPPLCLGFDLVVGLRLLWIRYSP